MDLTTRETGDDEPGPDKEEARQNDLDLPPEYCHYRDEGCEFATSCLNCPFPQCLYDEPRGRPPYHPRLMLKVLLYGYASGITSSRKLEERLGADVGFMVLAGQARPDHKTIAEFRRRHLAAFEGLFLTALRLCQAAGLAKLGLVAIDGTKLKAN